MSDLISMVDDTTERFLRKIDNWEIPQSDKKYIEMTDLTEEWKKGKLEEYKRYYCKTVGGEDIFMARCHNKGQNDEWWTLENEKYSYNNVYHIKDIEVLAEVPTYEELQDKLRALDAAHKTIKMEDETINRLVCSGKQCNYENAQLKELLLKAKGVIAAYRLSGSIRFYSNEDEECIIQIEKALGVR